MLLKYAGLADLHNFTNKAKQSTMVIQLSGLSLNVGGGKFQLVRLQRPLKRQYKCRFKVITSETGFTRVCISFVFDLVKVFSVLLEFSFRPGLM